MAIIYVSDADTRIGVDDNRLVATHADGVKQTLPIETVEGITLLTKVWLKV